MSYNVLFLNYNNWFCKFKRVVWFNFFKNKEKMKNFRKKVKKIFKVIKFLLRSFFKEKRFLMLLIGLILENLGLMILGVKSQLNCKILDKNVIIIKMIKIGKSNKKVFLVSWLNSF